MPDMTICPRCGKPYAEHQEKVFDGWLPVPMCDDELENKDEPS